MSTNQNYYHSNSLLFVHIPKAGGTTLNNILEKHYNPQNTFSINGSFPQESIDQFKNLSEAERQKIKLINGHMPFGLHEFLPNSSTYITMLRHPVQRIISHYYYVLRTSSHYLHEKVTSQNMTLKDYISSDISEELDNGQTKLIANIWQKQINSETEESKMLEIAKRNLSEHFSVVGTTEKFDETLLMLNKQLGLKNIFYVKKNIANNKNEKQTIPEEVLNIILQRNRLDMEIYKYSKDILEQSISQNAINFQLSLNTFKVLNYFYQKIYLSKQKVKRIFG